jgi:hypothetical protein
MHFLIIYEASVVLYVNCVDHYFKQTISSFLDGRAIADFATVDNWVD